MQRYWRVWDIHRGATLSVLAIAAAAVLTAGATWGPGPAQATDLDRAQSHWDGPVIDPDILGSTWNTCDQPIVYRTDAIGTDLELVNTAIERLAEVSGLTFAQGSPIAALPERSDEDLLIGFTDGTHALFASAPEAVGRVRTIVSSGKAVGAVIGIRTDRQLVEGFGAGSTQGNVLLHELGHAFGLPHSDDPTSLMYPTINDQQGDGFSATDIDALRVATRVPTVCP